MENSAKLTYAKNVDTIVSTGMRKLQVTLAQLDAGTHTDVLYVCIDHAQDLKLL